MADHIAVTPHVIARNSFGRFISEVEAAATRTVKDMLEEGVKISQALAPVGDKVDRRTRPLKDSFYVRQLSRTSGVWGNSARHALPIETGSVPHLIIGSPYLYFYWDKAGRRWIPGLYGEPDIVHHPGNKAQPYLRPAYEQVMSSAMAIARRNYPN